MFSRLATPVRLEAPSKRLVIYWGGLFPLFLAAVFLVLQSGLRAPKIILAERGIAAVPTDMRPRLAADYGKLPLTFEVNRGQTDPQVKYLSRGRGYTLFLTGEEAVLEARIQDSGFSSQASEIRNQKSEMKSRETSSITTGNPLMLGVFHSLPPKGAGAQLQRTTDHGPRTNHPIQNPKSKIQTQVVRLRLVGANGNADVAGADELPGKVNYFIGNDPGTWRTNLPTYAKVKYQGVYPGVDLV